MVARSGVVTDVLQRLYRTPPPEFIAERNRVVKALRTDGDRELASTVNAARRPGVSDWALNVAATDHADEVAEMVEAATEVIDAQEAAMDGRIGGDLRLRLKLLRVCTATVANLAHAVAEASEQTGSGSSVADVTTRLMEIAANRDALQLLGRGLLGAEDPGSADPFGLGQQVGLSQQVSELRAKPARDDAKPNQPTSSSIPATESGRVAAEERKRRRTAVADAKKALKAAEAAAEDAERAVAKQEAASQWRGSTWSRYRRRSCRTG